ncbi:hypothetical protein G6F62_014549 [Rhizopus arrhizus]|nr:hypothetical protein G6F62_014549 [Rhizopus arrhizus]
MCLPRSSGGLGVLDPGIQQHALQLRWLIPLLSGAPIGPPATFWTSPMICNSVVLPRLADCLLHHLQSDTTSSVFTWPLADYRLSFVFHDLRPPYVRSEREYLPSITNIWGITCSSGSTTETLDTSAASIPRLPR